MYTCCTQRVLTETVDWWVGPMPMRGVWRSAGVAHGEPCVMTTGPVSMQGLYADNLGSPDSVRVTIIYSDSISPSFSFHLF